MTVPGYLIFYRIVDGGAAVLIEALIRVEWPEAQQGDLGLL